MKLLKHIIILIILSVSIVNAASVDRLNGVWEGEGRQSSIANTQIWTIRFTAENGVYLIEYPSLDCSGTWTLVSQTSGSVTFFEDINVNASRCVDEGTVELLWLEDRKLRYTYYLPNGNIDAFGELVCIRCKQIPNPTGLWYDPLLDGLGFNLIKSEDGLVVLYYGYTNDGERLWLISDQEKQTFNIGETYVFKMHEGSDDNGASFNVKPVNGSGIAEWGTVSIRFDNCSTGTIIVNGNDGFQEFNVVKLVGIEGLICTDK
jgi:hypothetical protein